MITPRTQNCPKVRTFFNEYVHGIVYLHEKTVVRNICQLYFEFRQTPEVNPKKRKSGDGDRGQAGKRGVSDVPTAIAIVDNIMSHLLPFKWPEGGKGLTFHHHVAERVVANIRTAYASAPTNSAILVPNATKHPDVGSALLICLLSSFYRRTEHTSFHG